MRVVLLLTIGLWLPASQDGPQRLPSGTPDAGLPLPSATWRPYHADADHTLNRIFRRAWLVEVAPVHVGGALPREAHGRELGEALAPGWMLAWRDGTESDTRLFGGDGRQLPREGFDGPDSEALRADLDALTADDVAALRAQPALAVLFQHDLLRLAQRLEDAAQNPELSAPLFATAARVALPRAALMDLGDPLSSAGAAPDTPATRAYRERDTAFIEVLRRSTRLFDASRTLLWSRLFLAHPEGREAATKLVAEARGGTAVQVPVGMRALLVQGIVAIDDAGAPVATQLVVDVRHQVLANRDPLSRENATSSHDGVDFALLQLEREGLRRADERSVYRVVGDDDQDLFRDYGTSKHTTYRAQCALCHRTTRTPEPHLGGFPVLRPHAVPEVAETGVERLRLAEEQVRAWLASARGD